MPDNKSDRRVGNPPEFSSRYKTLDCIRGISALCVVAYHAVMHWGAHLSSVLEGGFSGGWQDALLYVCHSGHLGVAVFFMVSGYCISAAANVHRMAGYPVSRFVFRRFTRIYPPYWICLALCLLLSLANLPAGLGEDLSAVQWLANITLTEEPRARLLMGEDPKYFLPVAWTLCYEEQFYLLTFLLLLLIPAQIFHVFGILTAFVLLNTYGAQFASVIGLKELAGFRVDLTGSILDVRWLQFASGIGLFLFTNPARNQTFSRLRWIIPALLIALIWWEVRQLDWQTNRFQTRVLCFSIALLLCFVRPYDGRVEHSGVGRLLLWLGARTYSIYLVHLPLVLCLMHLEAHLGLKSKVFTLGLSVPLALFVSVAAGHYFHRFVEKRWVP